MKKTLTSLLIKISRFIYLITKVVSLITPQELRTKLKLKLEENLVEETFQNFKEYLKKSLIFDNVEKIREYAIETSLINDKNKEYYYLELGVFVGTSANFFYKYINKLYVFDSFEGLKEDWAGTAGSKGTFNLNKKIPKLNSNVEPIVG